MQELKDYHPHTLYEKDYWFFTLNYSVQEGLQHGKLDCG